MGSVEYFAPIMQHVPEGGNWRDLPPELLKEAMGGAHGAKGGQTGFFRRLHRDLPSPTIVGSPLQKSTLRWHPTENRPISIEEAAILQSYNLPAPSEGTRMSSELRALDLFAGTGWGVACQLLGIEEDGVELMDEAVATRKANGMNTIYRDVWDGLLLSREAHELLYGIYTLLIASPPCQTFSMAGNGAGRKALNEVIEAIRLHAYKNPADLLAFGEKHDMRTALVLSPLAYVYRDRPRLVTMEQVPTVLPVWEECAKVMRKWGYDVKVAVLNAEQYGVPQTRKRAILVARLDGPVSLPTPTHSKYYSRSPEKLDRGVKKWVSMAEALGWTSNPEDRIFCPTNLRPHAGYRAGDRPASALAFGHENPRWITPDDLGEYRANGTPCAGEKLTTEEISTLQSYPMGRGLTGRPSPTITGGGTETGGAEPIAKYHERYTNAEDWVGSTERLSPAEASVLQTYPTHMAAAGTSCQIVDPRPVTSPAATITGAATAEWGTRPTRASGPMDRDPEGRRMSPEEASVLQTYRRPFIWCGNKSKQFLQIGNAVPPLLAYAILSALTSTQTPEVAPEIRPTAVPNRLLPDIADEMKGHHIQTDYSDTRGRLVSGSFQSARLLDNGMVAVKLLRTMDGNEVLDSAVVNPGEGMPGRPFTSTLHLPEDHPVYAALTAPEDDLI